MRGTTVVLVLPFLLGSCGAPQQEAPAPPPPKVAPVTPEPKALHLNPRDRKTEVISLVRILAGPRALQGQPVSVIGYLHLEFEGDSLCLHQEDFERSIRNNCLWINVPPSPEARALSDRYVSVEGYVDAVDKGHEGMYQASIGNIMSIYPAFSRQEIKALTNRPVEGVQ